VEKGNRVVIIREAEQMINYARQPEGHDLSGQRQAPATRASGALPGYRIRVRPLLRSVNLAGRSPAPPARSGL
jgi:hypothetical protein